MSETKLIDACQNCREAKPHEVYSHSLVSGAKLDGFVHFVVPDGERRFAFQLDP